MSEENLFYILSPKDIVVAKLRDQDDHLAWLLEHEMFEVRVHQSISGLRYYVLDVYQ